MIDLSILEARTVLYALDAQEKFIVHLAGCGGTGSWMVPQLVRILQLMLDLGRITKAELILVDPDQVKEENIYRQNFFPHEIGLNKGMALALRYASYCTFPITSVPVRYETMNYRKPNIVVGCMDSRKSRREIHQRLLCYSGRDEVTPWWIDCGNLASNGQVLLGNSLKWKKIAYAISGSTTMSPLPSVQMKDLIDAKLDAAEKKQPGAWQLSCAEQVLVNAQGLTINPFMAGIAADLIAKLLVTQNLQTCATFVDLSAGTMRSTYITNKLRW